VWLPHRQKGSVGKQPPIHGLLSNGPSDPLGTDPGVDRAALPEETADAVSCLTTP
jgi:hypothetical protein